jgi:hypothetical protein
MGGVGGKRQHCHYFIGQIVSIYLGSYKRKYVCTVRHAIFSPEIDISLLDNIELSLVYAVNSV